MNKALVIMALVCGIAFVGYKTGYERAEARYVAEATRVAQKVTDAVSRAAQTLSYTTETLATAEGLDYRTLQEIEDAANADNPVCYVPVERLRSLDAIGQ